MNITEDSIGLQVRIGGDEGPISFYSEEYITITVSSRPQTCPNARRPTVDVNLLIYRQYWGNVVQL
jgi:hypothetical protein